MNSTYRIFDLEESQRAVECLIFTRLCMSYEALQKQICLNPETGDSLQASFKSWTRLDQEQAHQEDTD